MKFLFKKASKTIKRLFSRTDDLHLKRSGRYVSPSFVRKIKNNTQENKLEKIGIWIGIGAGVVGVVTGIIGVVAFRLEYDDRQEQRIFEAWQVVKDGKGSQSGVVRLALERLHKQGFNLSGINVKKTNLINIELNGANLINANLSNADLKYAKFIGSNFGNANLSNADLRGSKVIRANLRGTDLRGANLDYAKFYNSLYNRQTKFPKNFNPANQEMYLIASGSDLRGADLNGSNFFFDDLSGVKLSSANLSGTYLRYANFAAADLSNANLSGANLSNSHLLSANLSGANFSGANLNSATLLFADLSRAKNITPKQIKQAKNWEKAVYSPEFRKKLGLPPEEE